MGVAGTVGEGTSVEPAEETSTSLRETEDSTDSATSDTDNSETGVTEVSGPTGTGVVSPEVATLAGEAGTLSDAGVKCGCVVAARLSESTTALSAKDEEPNGVWELTEPLLTGGVAAEDTHGKVTEESDKDDAELTLPVLDSTDKTVEGVPTDEVVEGVPTEIVTLEETLVAA